MSNKLLEDLKTNLDGTINQNDITLTAPVYTHLKSRVILKDIQFSVNLILIIMLFLLSTVVVYTLMLADVEEQTYMFAMMRALGFRLTHIVGFVSLQAFTFSVPGMILGVAIAYVLNIGMRMAMFIVFGNYATYELSLMSIVTGILCFGIFVPLISNIGPTRLALGKNLRTSLDATRRNNAAGEEVSVTFQRLKDVSFSFKEVLFGLSLTLIGFVVYVFIPASIM